MDRGAAAGSEAPQVSAAPEGGGRRVCETIHNMANPARLRQTPVWGVAPDHATSCRNRSCLYFGTHVHHQTVRAGSEDPVRPRGVWPHFRQPLRGPRAAPGAGRAGRGVRHRPRGPGPARGADRGPGFRTLDAMLAGSDPDIVILRTPERPPRRPGDPGGRDGPPRDDRKADGHALAGRQAHGPRLRPGRRSPVRGQAEPAERHPAAA